MFVAVINEDINAACLFTYCLETLRQPVDIHVIKNCPKVIHIVWIG